MERSISTLITCITKHFVQESYEANHVYVMRQRSVRAVGPQLITNKMSLCDSCIVRCEEFLSVQFRLNGKYLAWCHT